MNPTIIGIDTETCNGPTITVQFYSDELPKVTGCIAVNGQNVTNRFLSHLGRHCKSGHFTLVGHNLKFDMPALFYDRLQLLNTNAGDFEFSCGQWLISGVYGTQSTKFARITHSKRDVSILLIDAQSWFMGSLSNAATLVCPDLPKLQRPAGIGSVLYTPKDEEFRAYAMRDAEISYHQGVTIRGWHQEFNIGQCVSVAHMASTIFQQNYIRESEPIWTAGQGIIWDALHSYHGGKNNIGGPQIERYWHDNVDAWDLSSAYPHAMTLLPAFSDTRLYVMGQVFSPRRRKFPSDGIYRISGKAAPCHWPVLFDNDTFKPLRPGNFDGVWITGHELNEARRQDEIQLSSVVGHYYKTDKDPVTDSAFSRYVMDFYRRKEQATDPLMRLLNKVLLNGLYGKLIQRKQVDPTETGIKWLPGPLFHPFAASLVTGHTRSVIHRLEHETQALHTATDGIFCGARHSPSSGGFSWAPATGLGSIQSEGENMEVAILRNKVYICYSDRPGDGQPSTYDPRKWVKKWAAHAYRGDLREFERMIHTDQRTYEYTKPQTLKDGIKRNKVINNFVPRTGTIKVGPMKGRLDWS